MVTIYDIASGVLCRASADASETNNADVSLDQSQDTENPGHSLHVEEQLALHEYEYLETTRDNADKIPPELASVNSDQFIRDMEK